MRTHVQDVTEELDAVVLRCLARKREDRFQTMADLADALRALPELQGGRGRSASRQQPR
jgi:hypothetical protein